MAPKAAYPDLSASSSLRAPVELSATLVSRFPFFRKIPKTAALALAQAARVRLYRKGESLCSAGDATAEIWALLDGRISINRCGWSGQRVSIEIMAPGDVFGLSALVCRTYPSEMRATRDSTVVSFPKEIFQRLSERHAALARAVLRTLGQRLHYVETMFLLSQELVDRRLAAALLYLHHKFGNRIPLNRLEIGEMAGTTPETARRQLKRLETRGWLRGGDGWVEIKDHEAIKGILR